MKIYRKGFESQKINAINNGNPVCPEKNRSPLNEKKLKNLDAWMTTASGYCPIQVKLMNAARIKTKNAAVFNVNGSFCKCDP
jgi:hypothetical protein